MSKKIISLIAAAVMVLGMSFALVGCGTSNEPTTSTPPTDVSAPADSPAQSPVDSPVQSPADSPETSPAA